LDTVAAGRQNPSMGVAGASREQLSRRLAAAYAEGLISEHTLSVRIEEVLGSRVIDPDRLVGDLHLRASEGGLRDRISQTMSTAIDRLGTIFADGSAPAPVLLGLDWTGVEHELLIGRSSRCDVVLSDPTISRRHARLIFRDGRWVVQDLASTNGTILNGRRVGRSGLRPGDELVLGQARLRID
jgi:hypothetical protein